MSDFNFNFPENEIPTLLPLEKNGVLHSNDSEVQVVDPNSIIVQVTENTPIVVLWGPAYCGKSIAMIRLARYLISKQYCVSPVKNFRFDDKVYERLCKDFGIYIKSHSAPKSTGAVNFMLLQVEKNNKKICQILEAPGEHYFDPKHPDAPLPTYLSTLINKEIPKVYLFFIEVDWENESEREMYSTKIANFISNSVGKDDSIVLLCNKSDKKSNYVYKGKPETRKYLSDIKRLYPQIFDRLGKRKGIFSSLISEGRHFDFVAFSSGEFKDTDNEGQMFVESREIYPASLWQIILKDIKGSWF